MDHNGNNGLLAVLCSTFLYLLSLFSVQAWASVAAIFAGVAAGCYNGYKFIIMLKERRKRKKS